MIKKKYLFILTFSLSGIFSKQINFSVPQPDETSVSFELELVRFERKAHQRSCNDTALDGLYFSLSFYE